MIVASADKRAFRAADVKVVESTTSSMPIPKNQPIVQQAPTGTKD